jgi:hypothetical protein
MSLLSFTPGRRPLWAGGRGSLLARVYPAAFALRQGKLFCRVPPVTSSLGIDISKAQKGKLRNNEHLSNRSSLSQPNEGLHEDMVLTEQEPCQ